MFNWLQHKLGIISLVETIAHHYRERDIAMEQWKYVLSRLSEIDDHLLKMQETLEANHPKHWFLLQACVCALHLSSDCDVVQRLTPLK